MITGGCLCGKVRYRIEAEPLTARYCWCRVCQYLALGNAAVGVGFPRAALAVEGELRDYQCVADSGNRMHRRFCPQCGTHLFSEAEERPGLVFVRAGSLDDREAIRPTAAIWVTSAPSWACIDESLTKWDHQPPPVA
jgi:hypothetical protein